MGLNGRASRLGLLALILATGCQYIGQQLHGLAAVAYTASPSQVLADGVDTATVQVRLTDVGGQPLPAGLPIQFSLDGQPFGPATQTDADGQAQSMFFGEVVGTRQVGVAVNVAGRTITAAAGSLTFLAPTGSAHLSLDLSATNLVAGESSVPTLQLHTAAGAPATRFNGLLSFSSNDPQASLPTALRFVGDANGQMVLPAMVWTSASNALPGGSTSLRVAVAPDVAASASLTVSAGAASRLGLHPSRAGLLACAPFALLVQLEDSYGNFVASPVDTVSLDLANNQAGALLLGPRSLKLDGKQPVSLTAVGISQDGNMLLTAASSQYRGQLALQVAPAAPQLGLQAPAPGTAVGNISLSFTLGGACDADLRLAFSTTSASDSAPTPASLAPAAAGGVGTQGLPSFNTSGKRTLIWDSARDLPSYGGPVYLILTATSAGISTTTSLGPITLGNGLAFATPSLLAGSNQGGPAGALATLDIDSNGYPDFLLGNGSDLYSVVPAVGVGGSPPARKLYSASGPILALAPGYVSANSAQGQRDVAICAKTADPTKSVLLVSDLAGTGSATPLAVRGCTAVALADLNRDGQQEVVALGTTAAGAPALATYSTTGSGNTLVTTGLPGPNTAVTQALLLADVNHDGFADALILRANDANVLVLPGLADAPYFAFSDAAAVYIPTGLADPRSLALADMDRDGQLDLVVAGASQTQIVALAGLQGGGDGPAPGSVLASAWPIGAPLALADFNGDGFVDVAGLAGTVPTVVLGSPGLGSGASQRLNLGGSVVGGASGLLAVNSTLKHGYVDLAFSSSGAPGLQLALNAQSLPSSGGLPGTRVEASTPNVSVQGVADLDGDGRLDLVALTNAGLTNAGTSIAAVQYFGAASASQPGQRFAASATGSVGVDSTVSQVLVGDWNADGKQDILALGSTAKAPAIWPLLGTGQGLGALAASTLSPTCGLPLGQGSILGDRDQDGHPELYIPTASGICIVDARTGASQLLSGGTLPQGTAVGLLEQVVAVALADMNLDGMPDLVVLASAKANGSASTLLQLTTYSGRDLGLLGSASAQVASVVALVLGDGDGDGYADALVAVGDGAGSAALWFVGDHAGGFGAPVRQALPCAPSALVGVAGGLTQVGVQMDLLLACSTTAEGYGLVQPKPSAGTAARTFSFSTFAGASFLWAGDVDGDGSPDLVASGPAGTALSLHDSREEQLLEGSQLALPNPLSAPLNLSSAAVAVDANADGYLDVVAIGAAGGSPNALLFYGNSQKTPRFGAPQPASAGSVALSPNLLRSGDLNGDGWVDLVAMNPGATQALVYFGRGRNQSPPFLAPEVVDFRNYGQIGDIVLADMDLDGRLDLVAATSYAPNTYALVAASFQVQGATGHAWPTTLLTQQSNSLGSDRGAVLAAADMNHDGATDLAIVFGSGDNPLQPVFFVSTGRNTGTSSNNLGSIPLNDLALVDSDQDGQVEVHWLVPYTRSTLLDHMPITVDLRTKQVLNNSIGSLPLPSGGPRQLGFLDLVGDRVPRAVVGRYSGNTSTWVDTVYPGGAIGRRIVAASPGFLTGDFNRDGRLDVGVVRTQQALTGPVQVLTAR